MVNWTREETILAFALYCKIPFGKIHKTNPQIAELAHQIGRTPSSVSMKMCNFGRFDPELQKRNVSGLSNGSKLDKMIWDEFSLDGENLITEAAKILAQYKNQSLTDLVDLSDLPDLPEGNEKQQIIKARLNQSFFRDTLFSSYHSACCITGINIPALLVASHIKPWKDSNPKNERISPANGLLLNAFHDKAFDKGYISINTQYEIMVSTKVSEFTINQTCQEWFMAYKGKKITLPEKFLPCKEFIEYHNDIVFLK
jgi:putative restriction endonuclease